MPPNTPTAAPTKLDLSAIRNPVIPGHYADPELRFHDNRFWLFPTYSAPYREQTFFDAFVSDDLVNWEKRPRVLELKDVAWSNQTCAWAPSVLPRYGSLFMFFSSGDGDGIGLGVWHHWLKKFVDPLRRPLIGEWPFGAQPIDANAFLDDDGQAYLYFGGQKQCVGVKLRDDMNGLDGPFRLLTPSTYVEGPFMFKRGGRYYFLWSEGGWGDSSYAVAYAITDSPWGPFDRIGTILKSDGVVANGPGHNSVLNVPGTDDWLICYHRRPVGETHADHRVTCIDRLFFRADGTIEPVVMT